MGVDNIRKGPQVPQWYAGRSVLVTGATGYVGKVLVEKLLRSCPDIATIYILVRHKCDQNPSQRAETFLSSMVFSRLRLERPDFGRHLSVVSGDLSDPDFRLAENELLALRRDVSVVFHCAASVRFDDSLRAAVRTNLVGTKNMLQLAEQLPHLQVFIHVSTSFCQCEYSSVEEKVYPAKVNPEKIISIVSLMDDDSLAGLTPKLLDGLPNTYALSKKLSEQLVANYGSKMPLAIARLSIVIPSLKEPMPGWVDNTNGPVGLIIAGGKGVLVSVLGNPDADVDLMPVDCTANAIIALAWDVAETRPPSPFVCNITNGRDNRITWGHIVDMLKLISLTEVPLEGGLWYPATKMRSTYLLHRLYVIIFQLLPAFFLDLLIRLSGRKPFLVNVQKRLDSVQSMLCYYTLQNWLFVNERLHSLSERMLPEDKEIFFFDVRSLGWFDYLKNSGIGVKSYILKEDVANMTKAKRHIKRLYYLHLTTQVIFYALLIWLLYSWTQPLLETLQFVPEQLVTQSYGANLAHVLAEEIPASSYVLE